MSLVALRLSSVEIKVVGADPEFIGAKRAHEASRASPDNLRV